MIALHSGALNRMHGKDKSRTSGILIFELFIFYDISVRIALLDFVCTVFDSHFAFARAVRRLATLHRCELLFLRVAASF
jgi:hypothetical protein